MTDPLTAKIVIIGAGQAASQCVDTLRKRGHTGPLTLIGDESLPPYQRPPLSKKFLAGTFERDRLLIRHASFYAEHGVDLRLGFAAVRIDRAARRVHLVDGGVLDYDRLLIATGSAPRRLPLPGTELAGVFSLRTAADTDALRAEIAPGRRAVIIGGGYIGLEVAATLTEAGVQVTVLEVADRVMNRVVSPEVSAFYAAEHARHGVEIRNGVRPRLLANGAGASRIDVHLEVGPPIGADFVLMAVGVTPTDELARAAGLACDNGILVDAHCRTSDPAIFAAGDCARHPSLHYGYPVRLESVDNAFEQGTAAALNLLGLTTAHDKVPWFWSDQFDLKMVIVGLAAGADARVLRGDPATRAFSVCYLKAGELIAVETVNHTKDQMAARKLIAARARPDPARLRDEHIPLREV